MTLTKENHDSLNMQMGLIGAMLDSMKPFLKQAIEDYGDADAGSVAYMTLVDDRPWKLAVLKALQSLCELPAMKKIIEVLEARAE